MSEKHVQQMVDEIMKERARYALNKYTSDLVRKFKQDNIAESLLDNLASVKRSLGQLDPRNPAPVQEIADKIAANTNIANDEIDIAFRRVIERVKDGVNEVIAATREAYQTAVKQLTVEADPFKSGEAQSMKMAYMTELQLTGGVPKTQKEIATLIQGAIDNQDKGALAFWSKNGAGLMASAEQSLPFSEKADLFSGLGKAVGKCRGYFEGEAHNKLEKLQSRWEEQEMDLTIRVAEFGTHGDSANASYIVQPRERTERERTIADSRAQIHKASELIAQNGGGLS